MLKKNEKKGLIIYLGTVFGITLLMGFLVRAAFRNNQPVSIYAGVQMLYPAMGVIIAVFFTRKDLFQKMLNWKTDFQFAKVNTCSWKSLQE